MAEKLNSVIVFSEWKRPLSGLSLEQKGVLLDALLDYPDRGDPEFTDPMLFMAWSFISNALHKNEQRYDEIREKRREAGKAGNAKRWEAKDSIANIANASFATNEIANIAISTSISESKSETSSESSSISESEGSDDDLTTTALEESFKRQIGYLSDLGKDELADFTAKLGAELVAEIINKCADLGGRSWAYVRKALAEAEKQGCRSVEEYRKTNPIGGGRNKRVDRPEPSGNDFLKNAARRRPLTKKAKEEAPDDTKQ